MSRRGHAAGLEDGDLALAWSTDQKAAAPPGTEHTICVLTGRVAGEAELARRLGLPAAPLEALIAQGYERLGEAVLDLVHGDFALLLWDRRSGRGLLARDRLGGRELYFKREPGGLVFASEIRDLMTALPRTPDADEVALAHWLARRPAPAGRTLLDGVERLSGGHLLQLGPAAEAARAWWTPRYEGVAGSDPASGAAGLRRAMTASVQRSLESAHSPAVLLSGGFDSACVVAIAKELAGDSGSPAAYSGVFPDHPEVDESAVIGHLRESLGLRGANRPFAGGSALAAATDFIRVWRQPPVSPNWFVWRPLLEQVAADGADVVLDGEGGDELFGCSPYLLADLLRRGRWRSMGTIARRIPGMGADPPRRLVQRAIARYGVRGALPPLLHALARRARHRDDPHPAWLSDRAREILADHDDPDAWKRRAGPRWWAYLVWAVVEGPDRMGAAQQIRREAELVGVQVNHPWRDAALVEHILKVRPELAFDAELDRALARRAMAGVVPEEVRARQAKPFFNALLEDSLGGVDAAAAGELIAGPPDALAPLIRQGPADGILKSRPTRTWSLEVWQIVTAATWLRTLAGDS